MSTSLKYHCLFVARSLLAGLLAASAAVANPAIVIAAPAFAQDANNDGTLHVLRPIAHAEQEQAELCLEFDHDLDAADHNHAASAIKLEASGKNIPVKSPNVSIANNLLCLPSLDHDREYRIVVTGLRGAKGEKLSGPYGLTFTLPDRQPSLSFTGAAADQGMTRWQDNDPVLRAVNVSEVHIELYRISDPLMMASAWRDRRQTTFAPSESATFGHDHGQLAWSDDIKLKKMPNKNLEQPIALKEALSKAPLGLYLIVARAPEVKEVKAETDIGTATETKAGALAATAASWLLRSDLRLHAVRDAEGFYGLAEKIQAPAVVKDVHLFIEDANAAKIAEGSSDASGTAFIAVPDERMKDAVTLFGINDAGDADFIDLTSNAVTTFTPPESQSVVATDKAFYVPAETVTAKFTMQDTKGHIATPSNTSIMIARADGSSYATIAVPANANGIATLSFPAPVTGGQWQLVWKQADGRILAQTALRVSANPDAPHVEINADRAIMASNGDVNLTLKSITLDGKPAPYIPGRIFTAWQATDNIFKEWKDYHFGTGNMVTGESMPLISFVTDEKGVVHFHYNFVPPDDNALLHNVTLTVQSDVAAGIAGSSPLTLSLKPKDDMIGIKPLAPNGRFPENGLARFNIVALDNDGHRRTIDDLAYRIYEEGRSFDWYQADGRWNYKPQQQGRRVGGGVLSLGASNDNNIEWPVATGSYRLEITDANGAVRASIGFSAGSGATDTPQVESLNVTPSVTAWQAGQKVQLRFALDKPSVVTAVIGDDRIRQVIHVLKSAGDNSIDFVPEKDWGDDVRFHIAVEDLDLAGQGHLPHLQNVASTVAKGSAAPDTFDMRAALPDDLAVNDVARFSVDLVNNTKQAGVYHYAITTTPDLKIADNNAGNITLPAEKAHPVTFILTALHAGSGTIKLDVSGPAHFHASRSWTISIDDRDKVHFGSAVRQRIEAQQITSWPPNPTLLEKTGDKVQGNNGSLLFLSPVPLYNAPALLADVVNTAPYTAAEITGSLETLRLWREVIIAAGLLSEPAIERRERHLLMQLIAQQKPDGGFAAWPGGMADFFNTAQALSVLSHSDWVAAKPAAEQASGWLRQRLDNTWFDENEREQRAAGFAALAEAGRMDNASLHYFSDTSAQKTVSPVACLQLALAFAKIGDEPASSFWIDKSGVKNNLSSLAPDLLPLLTANAFFDAQSILPSLEALSGGASKDKEPVHDFVAVTDILRAAWEIQNRKGAWRVTINTDKRSLRNTLVLAVLPKTPAPIIHNTGDSPIFLFGAPKENLPATNNGLTRRIYQLNGTEVGGRKPLIRDEIYLVVLESQAMNAASATVMHDDPGPALRITGCLPPAPIEADDALAWLKNQSLSIVTNCETGDGSINLLLAHKEGARDNAAWRAAYLAKADWSGTFNLQSATARNLAKGHDETNHTPSARVEIR